MVGNLTLDKFIVDFDFDIRDVAFDTKERLEMLCVFDNPTPRFSANEVSDIRDPYMFDLGTYFGTGTLSFSRKTIIMKMVNGIGLNRIFNVVGLERIRDNADVQNVSFSYLKLLEHSVTYENSATYSRRFPDFYLGMLTFFLVMTNDSLKDSALIVIST